MKKNYPSGMEEYLDFYGWHFSKKMCEFACSLMGNSEQVDSTDQKYKYDYIYLYNLFTHLELPVDKINKYMEQYNDVAFTHFYADCISNKMPIIWEDMI